MEQYQFRDGGFVATKKNIDAGLAVTKGRAEAEDRLAKKPGPKPKPAGSTTVATFTISTSLFLAIKRVALQAQEEGIPPMKAREGAVIEALCSVTLANPKRVEEAIKWLESKV